MNIFLSFSQILPPLIWIGLSSLLFTIGDLLLRFWIDKSYSLFFVAGLGIISVGMFCLSMSFPHQNIAVATVVSILFNLILYLLSAYLIFGDITTIKQSVGLILGFIAIFILEAL